MVTKSRLKMALQAEKGVDFKKQKQMKKAKEAEKRKRAQVQEEEDEEDEESSAEEAEEKAEGVESEDDDDEEEEEEEENQIDLEGVDDSDTSESSIELEDKLPRKPTKRPAEARRVEQNEGEGEDDEEEDEEEDEDIPMSDLEDLSDADKEDLIPHQRLTINNTSALLSSLSRIALPADSSVPFASHQSVVSASATADSIPDVADDLQRELAFSAQSLEAVRIARSRLRVEGVPFSRPKDYFAEMVKEDAHMDKVKAKLVEEASNKKAAAEARKLRDLKKFGKQVQVAKLQERQKAKRETLDKIKNLKRKRQENSGDLGTTEADLFDVGVDSELKKHSQRSGAGRGQPAANGKTNFKRQKKNEKYGFGGKKRHAKSGDALSSGDLSGFDAKRMKAGGRGKVAKSQRPGKARRKAMGTR